MNILRDLPKIQRGKNGEEWRLRKNMETSNLISHLFHKCTGNWCFLSLARARLVFGKARGFRAAGNRGGELNSVIRFISPPRPPPPLRVSGMWEREKSFSRPTDQGKKGGKRGGNGFSDGGKEEERSPFIKGIMALGEGGKDKMWGEKRSVKWKKHVVFPCIIENRSNVGYWLVFIHFGAHLFDILLSHDYLSKKFDQCIELCTIYLDTYLLYESSLIGHKHVFLTLSVLVPKASLPPSLRYKSIN